MSHNTCGAVLSADKLHACRRLAQLGMAACSSQIGVDAFTERFRDTHDYARREARLPEQRAEDVLDYRSLLHRDGSVLSSVSLQVHLSLACCAVRLELLQDLHRQPAGAACRGRAGQLFPAAPRRLCPLQRVSAGGPALQTSLPVMLRAAASFAWLLSRLDSARVTARGAPAGAAQRRRTCGLSPQHAVRKGVQHTALSLMPACGY